MASLLRVTRAVNITGVYMTLTHGAEGQHLYRLYLLGKNNIGLERETNMKGYKAFKKGLICKNKQYAENTVFEESEAIPCQSGMHFCENPIDVLHYYDLLDENGENPEFAEVESLNKPETDNGKKFCTTKLKVYEKLSLFKFIDICTDFLLGKSDNLDFKDYSRKASSSCCSRLVSLGQFSLIASAAEHSQLASSGNSARLASSGRGSQIVSAGPYSQQANSGDFSYLISSGNYSQIASSGYYSQLASSGDYSQLATSGKYSEIASLGESSQLASAGSSSRLANSGPRSQIVSAGDSSCINSQGEHSIICCAGDFSIVKAKKGSWITLSEWEYQNGKKVPKCVKTEYVDGERIKEDTFYMLRNGEFVEVKG